MASDNHANYAKIGLTVVLGVVAIVATLIYLGGAWGKGEEILVETYYDKSVSGLSVGSAVNFRGVKVGEVKEIAFVGNHYDVSGADNSRIYILMSLDGRTMIGRKSRSVSEASVAEHWSLMVDRLGLRATVTASGITGLSRIECDYNVGNPPEKPAITWTPEHLYIPPKISLLDSFSDSATKVMNQINKMDLSIAWSNMNSIVESLAAMGESTRSMIESRQGELDRLMADLGEAASSARDLLSKLRDNPSLLIREQTPAPLEETRGSGAGAY